MASNTSSAKPEIWTTKFSSCLITPSIFHVVAKYLEQPRTIFLQAKAEEFWLSVFELVLLFPLSRPALKCQRQKN